MDAAAMELLIKNIGGQGEGARTEVDDVATKFHDRIIGKTIIVTGVSPDGLGAEAAQALAAHQPKLLVLAGRSPEKGKATADKIASKYPGCKTRLLTLDLASLKQVEEAANEVLSWKDVENIDILINNAAIMTCPYMLTVDGIEAQIATNHLGPFLFTNLIMPKIVKSPEPRVVNVSSVGHAWGNTADAITDCNYSEGTTYNPSIAYGRGKTANILFSIALAKKLGPKGLVSIAPHPGGIKTPLQRWSDPDETEKLAQSVPGFKWKTLQQGAAGHLVSALDPAMKDHNGSYMVDCAIHDTALPFASDPQNAENVWKWSEKMVGKTFAY